MDKGLFLKEMGRRIRKARNAKKISLRELERLTHIDDVALMKIEQGKFNSHILTLKTIAEALEVDVKKLL